MCKHNFLFLERLFGRSRNARPLKDETKTTKSTCSIRKYGVNSSAPAFNSYTRVHTDAITCLCGLYDGVVASGSSDNTAVVFDTKTGRSLLNLCGHTKEICCLAYGDKKRVLFSGGRDKAIRMWDLNSGDGQSRQFEGHEFAVFGLAVSPTDNSKLMSGSRDHSVRLWDVETGCELGKREISRNLVTALTWFPNCDHTVAQTSEDKALRLWDSRTVDVAVEFPRKQYIEMSCSVSEDGRYCATTCNGFDGRGCEVSLYDVRGGRLLREYRGHRQSTTGCAFLSRGFLVSVSKDSSIRVWDPELSPGELVCLSLPLGGPLTSVCKVSSGGLCCGTTNAGVQILELRECDYDNAGVTLRQTAEY